MSSANEDVAIGWHFIVLMSRQGKIRLSEFFSSYSESEKRRILRDIAADVLPRQPKMCNIIEKGEFKFVYRRYASLYFIVGVPVGMNELLVLEQIHLFVEALDGYFNSGMCPSYCNTSNYVYLCERNGFTKLIFLREDIRLNVEMVIVYISSFFVLFFIILTFFILSGIILFWNESFQCVSWIWYFRFINL